MHQPQPQEPGIGPAQTEAPDDAQAGDGLPEGVGTAELAELVAGLSRPLPEVSPRYFYDDVGSALFEQITELPEYYPTRTEIGILEAHADDIVAAARPVELVELGSGAGRKIRLLLDAAARRGGLERCTMLDINASFMQASVDALAQSYPWLQVGGVDGDFLRDLHRLGAPPPTGHRLVMLLAGTIGNLHPDDVPGLLHAVAGTLDVGGGFLVGFDLVKDPDLITAAYNDSQGVTAQFNLNALPVLNARFGTDFAPEHWTHHAFWDATNAWVDIRLRCTAPTSVTVPGTGFTRRFQPGDTLRTELSCKYTRGRVDAACAVTDLSVRHWWTDPDGWFALALLCKDGVRA